MKLSIKSGLHEHECPVCEAVWQHDVHACSADMTGDDLDRACGRCAAEIAEGVCVCGAIQGEEPCGCIVAMDSMRTLGLDPAADWRP